MVDRLQGSTIVLHGPPKVGKTQLVAQFPGPVQWLATEYGHRYIPDDQQKNLVQLTNEDGWADFKKFIASKVKFKKMKTLAVDTVAELYYACMKWVCDKNNWEHPQDGAHGKGWNTVKREFMHGLTRLADLCAQNNITTIFIDHSKEETIETATSSVEKVVCAMPGQCRNIILSIPDHIWFLGYGEKKAKDAFINTTAKRALFVTGSGMVEAGCRDPEVITKIIMPLRKTSPYRQIVKTLYGPKVEEQ